MKELYKNLGIDVLNPMQLSVLDKWDKHDAVILLSPTGSGKTLAFLLPIINHLKPDLKKVQSMIVVPSRELGIQIEQVFKKLNSGYKVNLCYGGHSTGTEINNLSEPPAVIIGTPGRLCYHLRKKTFEISLVNTLVLDEFDKCLEMGFQEEMSFIIQSLSSLKKKALTSATNLETIPGFTKISNPVTIDFLTENKQESKLKLKFARIKSAEKFEALFKLICMIGNEPTIVFCNHRDAVDRISTILKENKIDHDIFHGGLDQDERERALIKFRNESHRILLTTDLGSRGLDIPEVKNIIHYQLPLNYESFTHRNGRTARMNASGTAYLLLSEDEQKPEYIKEEIEEVKIDEKVKSPQAPKFITLYFGAGKKDKINKIDILGFLLKNSSLDKDDVGKIEVLDNASYVAVMRYKAPEVIRQIKDQKIKNRKIKVEISF